jgi:uncharacterized protein YecT (DUF1311 family)
LAAPGRGWLVRGPVLGRQPGAGVGRKATIVAAQKAWVSFKESDCGAVQYEWWGSSGAGIAETSCLYARTAQRVEDLKERYLDR